MFSMLRKNLRIVESVKHFLTLIFFSTLNCNIFIDNNFSFYFNFPFEKIKFYKNNNNNKKRNKKIYEVIFALFVFSTEES